MLEYVLAHLDSLLTIASMIVAAAAAIAALTPTPKDDSILAVVRKVVDFLALNFGNAKNHQGVDVKRSEAQDVKTRVLGPRK